ncbi:uncharacterized protein LOC110944058 [Helianthus annuus]|uniref:uncharacterized protein LOC110944058 n=1 Tax=Helianthus annuus TaxID=4232 RepID=UPI000B902300|nr:uncharacterized protein LOC110944058 [Helianthus annuus]
MEVYGSKDIWLWGENGKDTFSVAMVKNLIREGMEDRREQLMQWETWIPMKVNLFVWRAEMERIRTKVALMRRRINVQDGMCSLCDSGDEDVMHLFTGCTFSFGVWLAMGKWCNIAPIMAFHFKDLLSIQDQVPGCKWAKKVIRGIVMVTCWALWKARNEKVFQGTNPKVVEVVAMVKSWSFLWLKGMSKFANIVWKIGLLIRCI